MRTATGTKGTPVAVTQDQWSRASEQTRSKYDHVHVDGYCERNRFGLRCEGASAHPRPLIWTLYVDYEGNAYRLRRYSLDMSTFARNEEATYYPDYSVVLTNGSFSSATRLPEGARKVWEPRDERKP